MSWVEIGAGALFALVGLRSAVRSVREMGSEGRVRDRALMALHETAKAGFWLSLGAFFLGYALLPDLSGFRWFIMAPIVMAGLRLLAATRLGPREPPRSD